MNTQNQKPLSEDYGKHTRWHDPENELEKVKAERDELLALIEAVKSGDKVWGGQLLGWTTQAEVDALDKSIETDW